jgi:hypothetical protein
MKVNKAKKKYFYFYESKSRKMARRLVWWLDMSGGSAGNAAHFPRLR